MTTNTEGGKKLISADQLPAHCNVLLQTLQLMIAANNTLATKMQKSTTLGPNDAALLNQWTEAVAEVIEGMRGEMDRMNARPDGSALN